jgi:2',3'-cyclic-nucleotide 2'-phosphodiesterase
VPEKQHPAASRDIAEVQAADRLRQLPEVPERGSVRVLMIGDVIGKPGRQAIERTLPSMREERRVDLVIANGENLAGGMGLTSTTAAILFESGVDVITSGNHIWDKKEIYPELDRNERILRPINYGDQGVPGRGWGIYHAADGSEVAVINAQGRTFMQPIENPFTTIDALLEGGADELPPVRIVDFHCEITSEKNAWGCTSTAGSAPSPARTPMSPQPTSGSCPVARPTSATSA